MTLGRRLNLAITALLPVARMIHCARSNHVEVDVNQAAMQVLVGFNGGCVIAIFSKSALVTFALVVLLCGTTSDELHALGNDV